MEIRKGKPFSDITNAYDLIPTSTLRKLVSSSGSNSSPALKPPISIFKSDSGFRGQKVCPTLDGVDTKSDTSIGSSVNIARAPTSRTMRFRSREMGNKDILYNARQATDEFKNVRKSSAMTDSSTPLAKKKDKGKAIARPPRRIGKPCSSLEKTEENVMANLSLFSASFDKVKGFRKGIINPSSCSHEKTENRSANLNYSGCSKNKTEEDLGKEIFNHSSYAFDKKKDKEEMNLELPGLFVQKTKAVGKAVLDSNGFLVDKTKEKLKSINLSRYSHEKTREKGKAIVSVFNMVEGSSAAVAVNCEHARSKTVKRKKDFGATSCPPMKRTQKILHDFGEAGDMKKLSKSRTVPRPKYKKKQCPQPRTDDESCLPLDFIELRAYFKEVDEFELAEEEISQDELE